jgi:multidrug efflux pump subunit AcrA (membrane-fusion protein)
MGADPITAAILIGASSAMSGFSAYKQQEAANAQADYQAKVAENNAKTAEYEAAYAEAAAEQKAMEQRRRTQSFLSRQRAAMGASGLQVDSGTFLDIQLDTVTQGKLDEMAILHEGDLGAWRANVQAENYRSQAKLYKGSKSDPFTSGLLTGAVGGLQTAASLGVGTDSSPFKGLFKKDEA